SADVEQAAQPRRGDDRVDGQRRAGKQRHAGGGRGDRVGPGACRCLVGHGRKQVEPATEFRVLACEAFDGRRRERRRAHRPRGDAATAVLPAKGMTTGVLAYGFAPACSSMPPWLPTSAPGPPARWRVASGLVQAVSAASVISSSTSTNVSKRASARRPPTRNTRREPSSISSAIEVDALDTRNTAPSSVVSDQIGRFVTASSTPV